MTETRAKNHVLTPSSYRGHVFGLTEIEHFSIRSSEPYRSLIKLMILGLPRIWHVAKKDTAKIMHLKFIFII